MAFNGMQGFVSFLDSAGELQRVKTFVNPVLEIPEVADRMVKSGRKALLFEKNGTDFPLLINAFASEARMKAAIHRPSLEDAGAEMVSLFNSLGSEKSIIEKLAGLPRLAQLLKIAPKHIRGRGTCQELVMDQPDLGKLPILKCWPYDGGRFITLPLVHTRNPFTLKTNVGMYRMQVMGPIKTGMHWHRHKTGARHFEAWKEKGEKMPVTVTLGGDPVYTYAATAPMPENIDEYLLAGFLRHKRVRLVKCLTNDLWVPDDSDFVIEGYVDPTEELVWEGPFGDHTGFYSLADWYPAFHVTCITHRRDAVYPATIVGVPPMEDAWIGKATEKIFMAPIKMAIAPEILDIHMPVAGVAHNLVIVKIVKEYPGQGLKVLNALFGAGQMMFSKYIVVVSGNTSPEDYKAVANDIFRNADLKSDILTLKGPLDVLDHSSDTCSFGGKLGIDATEKLPEETTGKSISPKLSINEVNEQMSESALDYSVYSESGYILILISVPGGEVQFRNTGAIDRLPACCSLAGVVTVLLNGGVDKNNIGMVAWYILGNTDPVRDIYSLQNGGKVIDATPKIYAEFTRQWPNVVCSDDNTINYIDNHWDSFGLERFITSPSLSIKGIVMEGDAVVMKKSKNSSSNV